MGCHETGWGALVGGMLQSHEGYAKGEPRQDLEIAVTASTRAATPDGVMANRH